ncbi:hypothetical protein L2E82_53252 [Cichorium intybus]|nr:hypothetical protein L2E82_53252 [Cichorium intybus]
MTHEVSGTPAIRHVENVDVDVYTCIRNNVSVQTGEEFSPEFLRAHKPKLDIQIGEESFRDYHQDSNTPTLTPTRTPTTPTPISNVTDQRQHRRVGFQYTQNPQFVYEDASCSGIIKRESDYTKGFPMEIEKNSYPDVLRYQNKDHTFKGYHQIQQHQQKTMYLDEIYNNQVCYTHNSSPLYSHISGVPDCSFPGKLKFLCSFGGKILPRPSDGKLRYVGGETRIISVLKNINYHELMEKTCAIFHQPHTIKYQLPGEDLDALISVSSDEDFRHMIEEYHDLEKDSQRLRMFLVSVSEPGSPCSYDSRSVDHSDNGSYEYVVAVNGISGSNLRKCSSKDNLDGVSLDFTPTLSNNRPSSSNSNSNFIQMPSNFIPSNIQSTKTYHVNSTPGGNNQQLDRYLVESIMTCGDHSCDAIVSSLLHPNGEWWCEDLENNPSISKQVNVPSLIPNQQEKVTSFVYNRQEDVVKEKSQPSGNEVVWEEEDMIQWTETSNSNFNFESKDENRYADSPARTASSDMASDICSILQHTGENPKKSNESDSILRSNLNENKNKHNNSGLEIPIAAIFTPFNFVRVESYEENIGDKRVLSHTSNDKIGNDIPAIPVLVDDVTDNMPPGILSATKVVPYIQQQPDTDNKDVVDDKKVKDVVVSDTAIAEVEAGIYGLQIIRNADLEELRELGSGTFGTVYHGKWRGTDVAIKRIRKSCFAGNSSEQERLTKDFWREAQLLSNLHHPNVVALYGVVPDGPGGTLSTVTEYMANGSLRHVLLEKKRAFDWRKKLIITQDAAIGMEYLHSKKIVHFDLKCENLLVNLGDPQRPICKVGDFGLSRIKHNTFVSGGVRGTLPWMAPELLNGSSTRVSEKVDVFSFGIAMWEMLTEEEPYADMHCGAIIGGIVSNTLRPPIPERCDRRWKALMEECWSYDPIDRPSFTEITNKLQGMLMALQSKRHKNSKDEIVKPL